MEDILRINSVEEAESIAKLMLLKEDIEGLYALKQLALQEEVTGAASDYHNFSVNYARRGDHISACEILRKGLLQHPMSTDLLADFIKYGIQCNLLEECEEKYQQLASIPKERWTWRSFDFTIDYLKDRLAMLSDENAIEEQKQKMIELVHEFRKCLPYDEQSYLAEAEIYESFLMFGESANILKKGIEEVKVAPKCCLKYADIMLERGEYQSVIETASKGICASAQDQATVNIGYLYYVSALAKDALIHANSNFDDEKAIKDVYTDYTIAEKLFDTARIAYLSTIKNRTLILEYKSGIPYNNKVKNNVPE